MAITLDQLAEQARFLLKDADKVRYPDDILAGALNVAITDMMRIRPDIVSLNGTITGFPYDGGSLSSGLALPVDDQFFGPLIAFVVGWVELVDDEFAVDNRAVTLLTRFQNQLVMGG